MISRKQDFFSPCPDCLHMERNKRIPPDDAGPYVCSCGKAFIDDVFVRLYHTLVDTGLFTGTEPLSAVGTPLIDPGLFLRVPPHLPPRSLLLISSAFDAVTAQTAHRDVPQLSCILSGADCTPGIGDIRDLPGQSGSEYELLCGCDVRADIFSTSNGPVVVYKKQGSIHIEFPHGIDPKIRSLEGAVRRVHPQLFVDACSGPGTLGLCGMRLGVKHAILNDPWYAAAFFSGFNILVNQEILGLDECSLSTDLVSLSKEPVRKEPFPVAHGYGPDTGIDVFQGMMEFLPPEITQSPVLTAFDPFDKREFSINKSFLSFWHDTVGGEVFIP